MLSAGFAFAGSLLIALLMTPLVRRFALRVGAVDVPGERRVHAQIVPRLGGLAMLCAFLTSLLGLFIVESEVAQIFFATPRLIMGLTLGGLIVCGLGAIDDLRGVRAVHKLWTQCAAAVVAYACGFRIDAVKLPFLGDLDMGVFGIVVTALWIVAVINAINLIDGLDGLAGGVAFFACVTNFVVGAINNDAIVMLLSASLGGAVLGFLTFNFNPASIFMGDSGSMFLGYVLATTSILGNSVKSSTTVALLVPLVALGLPIIDTLLAMLRRVLERRSIFAADRGHIHHQLLAMGLTHRRAVLLLYGMSILFTASAIIVSLGRNTQVGAALVVITLAVVVLVRTVGNFDVAIRRWLRRERSRTPAVERMRRCAPRAIERIAAVRDSRDLLGVLKEFAAEAQLESVELVANEHPLGGFKWSRTRVEAGDSQPPLVGTSFVVPALGPGASLQFSWRTDAGDVGPDAEILLQLIADAIEARVSRASEPRREIASGHRFLA